MTNTIQNMDTYRRSDGSILRMVRMMQPCFSDVRLLFILSLSLTVWVSPVAFMWHANEFLLKHEHSSSSFTYSVLENLPSAQRMNPIQYFIAKELSVTMSA